MTVEFARYRDGEITPIRYSERQLRFNKTLEIVLSSGDWVIPLHRPAPNLSDTNKPLYRPATQYELDTRVKSIADLEKLVDSDLGTHVAPLNDDLDIPMNYLPDTITSYKGLWDPSKNEPELKDGVGNLGDIYQVAVGYPNDFKVDLGGGDIRVRSGMRVEYIDGRWKSTGFIRLSNYERSLLEGTKVRPKSGILEGGYGNQHGLFDIVTYPSALETLNGGIVVGQLEAVNALYQEMHLVDNDGLDNLLFNPLTSEIFLDAENTPQGTYRPKFIVATPNNHSQPISVRIDVLEYYLEHDSDKIIINSGEVHAEPVTSPQDDTPTLKIVDNGETWGARVSDDGTKVEIDTFCCDAGIYHVDVVSQGIKGTSDVLRIESEVVLKPGQEAPFWQKESVVQGGLSPVGDKKALHRADLIPLDSIPLDSEY